MAKPKLVKQNWFNFSLCKFTTTRAHPTMHGLIFSKTSLFMRSRNKYLIIGIEKIDWKICYGSVALLSHFHKVLALSKFPLLKCEIEVNPIARIPRATTTSTTQIEITQCWWPRESVLWGSLQFLTLKVRILKVWK